MLPGPVTEGQEGASQASGGAYRPTNVAYVDSRTPGAYERREAARRSVKLPYIVPTSVESRALNFG